MKFKEAVIRLSTIWNYAEQLSNFDFKNNTLIPSTYLFDVQKKTDCSAGKKNSAQKSGNFRPSSLFSKNPDVHAIP